MYVLHLGSHKALMPFFMYRNHRQGVDSGFEADREYAAEHHALDNQRSTSQEAVERQAQLSTVAPLTQSVIFDVAPTPASVVTPEMSYGAAAKIGFLGCCLLRLHLI